VSEWSNNFTVKKIEIHAKTIVNPLGMFKTVRM
jgi:hypothetical protein